jgi:hypothetical protein
VPDQTFPYAIDFENQASATAPAQVVVVSQQLESGLDLGTFQLGSFSFGGLTFSVPAGRTFYSTRLDLRSTLGLYVDVNIGLNEVTGVVTWTFTSVDPQTFDLPTSALAGFLPPDVTAPEGEGFVSYLIRPKLGDPTGTRINAKATVVFDNNAPLDTPVIFNTIDGGPPTSTVNPLPAVTSSSSPSFVVSWLGADDAGGSGIAFFEIYVSTDNGPFMPFLLGTTQTSATFTGQFGHSYSFYSVATDNVGNRQATPSAAQAVTELVFQTISSTTTTVASSSASSVYGQMVTFTATITAGGSPVTVGTVTFQEGNLMLASAVPLDSNGHASFMISSLSAATSPYAITAYYNGTSSLATSSGSTNLTVTPAPLTVTANNATKVYGQANPTFSVSYSGFVNGDTVASLGGTLGLSTPANAAGPVGTYAITPSGLTSSNYTINFANGTLAITAAPLSVTANNATKVYGQLNPVFTVSYSGFVNGDTASSLGGTLSFSTPATASSSVGSYAITPSGLTSTNYTITFVNGTLTITPAALTVTADNKTKVYGQANPTFTASYTGFVNGDTVSALSGSLSFSTPATTSSSAGTYAIMPSGLTATNYTITFVNGTLTITPAPLTVTANNATKVYGQANPAFTVSYYGFVNGDTASSLGGTLSFSMPATASSPAGTYAITPSGLTSSNYRITFANGTFTITPAPLTVTANNATKVYGQANPTFTVSYSGFVNGDTSSVLSGKPSLSTTATSTSPVGSYPITVTQGTLSDANYTFTFVNGTLTVGQDATTTTASVPSSSLNFGQALTVTASVTANAPGSGTPTGKVDFYDTTTATDLGSISLSSGNASLTVNQLPAGNNMLTLSYSGDSNFLTSGTTLTVTVNTSILVLDPKASGAFTLSGSANINLRGNVVVDSNSSSALTASGSAVLKASSIQVVGKVQQSGATISPAPVTGASPVADPLANLPAPSTSGLTNYGAANIAGSTKTLQPGIYSQISISGSASVTLNPGVYIIEGGGFIVSGSASVTGTGIVIYNTGSKYPNAGGTYGAITVSGSGTLKLSPATTGVYAGILIDQDPKNTQVVTISGSASVVTGIIYAPKAQLMLSGSAQLNSILDVDLLTVSGSAVDNGTSPPGGAAANTPAPDQLAYGLSALSAGSAAGAGLPTLLESTGQIMALANPSNDPATFQTDGENRTARLESRVQSAYRLPPEDIVDAYWWLPARSREQTTATDVLFAAFE